MAWLQLTIAVICVALSSSFDYNEETAAMFDEPPSESNSRRRRALEHQSLFLSTSCDEIGVESRLTDEQKQWILDYHNDRRAESGSSNMNKMFWDDDLACQAQRVVDSCQWGHNDIRAKKDGKMLIGQNIVAGYIDKDVKDVDKELMIRLNKYYFDEIKYYTYPEPDCMGDHECNHYRVMMIAASTKIGGACGICDKVWRKTKEVEDLSQKDKNVVFCVNNYDKPLSSISGIKLFEKGPPCSACPLNWAKCVNKLCVACKEGEDGCKHFDNCKDISTAATCNYVKSKKLCEGYKGNCAKTCD